MKKQSEVNVLISKDMATTAKGYTCHACIAT